MGPHYSYFTYLVALNDKCRNKLPGGGRIGVTGTDFFLLPRRPALKDLPTCCLAEPRSNANSIDCHSLQREQIPRLHGGVHLRVQPSTKSILLDFLWNLPGTHKNLLPDPSRQRDMPNVCLCVVCPHSPRFLENLHRPPSESEWALPCAGLCSPGRFSQ